MKRIQIILFSIGVVLAMQVHAQQLAEPPRHTIQSTSTMPYSGSHLPMAAESGVQMSWSSNSGTGSLSNRNIRRSGGFEDDDPPQNPADPFPDSPIGDAALPLALCALAYLIIRVTRKRRIAR